MTRDPARIPPIIADLARYWRAHPDLRLGQITGDGYTISEDRAANRVRIVFADRQPSAVVSALRSCGFRWAPTVGAWQRQASTGAWAAALRVVATIGGAS